MIEKIINWRESLQTQILDMMVAMVRREEWSSEAIKFYFLHKNLKEVLFLL